MLRLKRNKLMGLLVGTAMLAVAVVLVFMVVLMKSSGVVVVQKAEYDRMKSVDVKFGKLYDMQDTLEQNALGDVSTAKQMTALYKALAASMEDPYTVYMTADEATAWDSEINTEKSISGSMLDDSIAYIQIRSISQNSGQEFATNLKALESQGAKALIIDLRGNGGGYTEQGISIADQILPEGTITSTVDQTGERTYYNSDEQTTKLPYVLLVDGETASAAEIIAAAVKDNQGGKILGTVTYGKGVTQSELIFEDGSLLHYTTGEFFSPTGAKIDGLGVQPDVTLTEEEEKAEGDSLLKKAQELLAS